MSDNNPSEKEEKEGEITPAGFVFMPGGTYIGEDGARLFSTGEGEETMTDDQKNANGSKKKDPNNQTIDEKNRDEILKQRVVGLEPVEIKPEIQGESATDQAALIQPEPVKPVSAEQMAERMGEKPATPKPVKQPETVEEMAKVAKATEPEKPYVPFGERPWVKTTKDIGSRALNGVYSGGAAVLEYLNEGRKEVGNVVADYRELRGLNEKVEAAKKATEKSIRARLREQNEENGFDISLIVDAEGMRKVHKAYNELDALTPERNEQFDELRELALDYVPLREAQKFKRVTDSIELGKTANGIKMDDLSRAISSELSERQGLETDLQKTFDSYVEAVVELETRVSAATDEVIAQRDMVSERLSVRLRKAGAYVGTAIGVAAAVVSGAIYMTRATPADYQELRAQLSAEQERAEGLQEDLEGLTGNFEKSMTRLERSVEENISLKRRVAGLETQVKSYEASNGDAGKALAEAREALAEAKAAGAKYEATIAQYQEQVGRLQEENKEYKGKQAVAGTELQALRKKAQQYDTLVRQKGDLGGRVAELQDELKMLKEDQDEARLEAITFGISINDTMRELQDEVIRKISLYRQEGADAPYYDAQKGYDLFKSIALRDIVKQHEGEPRIQNFMNGLRTLDYNVADNVTFYQVMIQAGLVKRPRNNKPEIEERNFRDFQRIFESYRQ